MNIRMVIAVLAVFCLLPLSGFAETTQADYKAAYDEAMVVHEKVIARHNEWNTTHKVFAAAQKAAEAGEYEKATQLAQQGQLLAKAALQQSKHQDKVWKAAIPD